MVQSTCALIFLLLCCGCAAVAPDSVKAIDSKHTQVIHVSPTTNNKQRAVLTFWEQANGQWQRVYVMPAVLGRSGLAKPGQKKEGDGFTPAGTFDLKRAFGYDKTFTTGLNYKAVSKDDFWVDDPASPAYNQWVHGKTDAKSYELLKRADDLYQYSAVIEYNTDPVIAGAGSAIFMHIWRRWDHPTAGCVALSKRHLRRVLNRLGASHYPIIILEERGHGSRAAQQRPKDCGCS